MAVTESGFIIVIQSIYLQTLQNLKSFSCRYIKYAQNENNSEYMQNLKVIAIEKIQGVALSLIHI